MVYNCFIKCQVCNSITRIRIQVGYLEEHPIVVSCCKCGVSLNGKVKIGQDTPSLSFEFENADIITNPSQTDYVVECSSEFPVRKPYLSVDNAEIQISPFMLNIIKMDKKGFEDFGKDISILNEFYHNWSKVKRVFDLFRIDNKTYLLPEIWDLLPKNNFPCRNEFEIIRAIHSLEIHYLISPLRKDLLENLDFSSNILRSLKFADQNCLNFFKSHDGYSLPQMQAAIYKIYDNFASVYPALIPAIATRYYSNEKVDYEREGSTTSSFDTVKQFSLDTYETLGNLLVIPIALNNIKYRNDFNQCISIDQKSISLEKFIELPKAKRFTYCQDGEIYTEKLKAVFNSKLRNAIGHNDIDYDSISQKITYIPDPRNRAKKMTTFLLEFENEALQLFQSILVISEYLYRLQEFNLIKQGMIPLPPAELDKKFHKVGRNEPCPCGSGLKFKRCHGR